MSMLHRFGPATAVAVIVANMVGTGVFTSLGFQLLDIDSGFSIVLLWLLGGVSALCGALCYAELGATLPRSGGEYNFLSRIYHPAAGFISGWLSATIGFAAPTALAAMTFAAYLSAALPGLPETSLAVALVVLLTMLHVRSHASSGNTQLAFTAIKVAFIAAFCVAAACLAPAFEPIGFLPAARDGTLVATSAFAVSLIYVNYAYTGWNAATYLTDELADPQRNLPQILLIGTAIVAVLYIMLNMTFLLVAPMQEMRGQIEIGVIAARAAFGDIGGRIMGLALAALLISTVSAMIMAGPRVLQVIGQDFAVFRYFARTSAGGIPRIAILLQSALTLAFILTGTFESILIFAGFTLGVSTWVTVFGVFVLRWREPDRPRPFRTWGYPLPPLLYLAITSWTLVHIVLERPVEALWGAALFAVGGVLYLLSRIFSPATRTTDRPGT